MGAGGTKQVIAVLNAKIIKKDFDSKTTVKEGCLSFPDRGDKKIQRFMRIKVRFQMPIPNRWTEVDAIGPRQKLELEEREEWVEGYLARIFAHEIEHASGKNIYQ